ncbi:MAG: right-handed parallel beta-helix repeat-containing protein [Candidatus Margulisiibacteriota bacterium]
MTTEAIASRLSSLKQELYQPGRQTVTPAKQSVLPDVSYQPVIIPPVRPAPEPLPGDIPVAPGESIQAAIDSAPAGSTIVLAAGDYQENIILKDGVSLRGAGANQTTLSAAEAALPVISGDAGQLTISNFAINGGSPAVFLKGDGITVNDLLVDGGDAGLSFDGTDVLITGCKIIHIAGTGVELLNADGSTVNATIIARCEGDGLRISDSTGVTVVNNTLVYNKQNSGAGVKVANSTAVAIANNIIAGNYYGVLVESGEAAVNFNDIWGNNKGCEGCAAGVLELNADGWDIFDNIAQSPVLIGEGEALFDDNWQFTEFTYVDNDFNLNIEPVGDVPVSPCINAGDPDLIDRDGTILDQGAYGGLTSLYDATPTEFTLVDDGNSVTLSWVRPEGVPVLGYRLYRLPVDTYGGWASEYDLYQQLNQPYALLADIQDPQTTSYTDTGFPTDAQMIYFYKAVTVHGPNESRPTADQTFYWYPGLFGGDDDAGADAAVDNDQAGGCGCSAVGRPAAGGNILNSLWSIIVD